MTEDFDGRPLVMKPDFVPGMGLRLAKKGEVAMKETDEYPPEFHAEIERIERNKRDDDLLARITAMKETEGKPRLELIAPHFELGMAEVLTDVVDSGKYEAEDWRRGREWKEYIAAAKRHLNAIERNEDHDPKSGRLHAYHLGCCAMILSEYQRLIGKYGVFDNREKDPVEVIEAIARRN